MKLLISTFTLFLFISLSAFSYKNENYKNLNDWLSAVNTDNIQADLDLCLALSVFIAENESVSEALLFSDYVTSRTNYSNFRDMEDYAKYIFYLMSNKVVDEFIWGFGSDDIETIEDFVEYTETKYYLNQYEITPDLFQKSIIVFFRSCVPVIFEESENIMNELEYFQQKVIRNLTIVPN